MNEPVRMVTPSLLSVFAKSTIKPLLEDYKQIISGRESKYLHLRPREVLGLFIVAAVGQFLEPDKNNIWTISTDPDSGDGVVICGEGPREGEGYALEQVYVMANDPLETTDAIIAAIEKKVGKGANYGKDRHLVVLCDKSGIVDLVAVRRYVLQKECFLSYWIITWNKKLSNWSWTVTTAKATTDPPHIYDFSFQDNFKSWKVCRIAKIRGT